MSRIAITAALLIAAVQVAPTSAATFLFVRHAESAANAGTATTVEEFLDPPLTALGEQQALSLVDVLAAYDVTSIYTSAYQRTQATIAPTAAHFGLTPTADARTNEWYIGDIESLADIDSNSIYGVFAAWGAGDTSAKADLPNAESLDDMAARVLPAWEEIIDAHADDDGVVVLVGHGAEMGYVMPFFAQNVSLDFAAAHPLDNTGIIQLETINGQPCVTNWQGIEVAVPEPASWLMLAFGLGGLVGVARLGTRREKAAA